jgi:hypothetical protein
MITKLEWDNANEDGRWRAIAKALQETSDWTDAPQRLKALDFTGLQNLFGFPYCSLYAVPVAERWEWRAGFGLQILGVACCSAGDFAYADDAREAGLRALDLALRQLVRGWLDPWNKTYQAKVLGSALCTKLFGAAP